MSESKPMGEMLTLRDQVKQLQAIVDYVQLQTHLCSGRDCIGYYFEHTSASEYQCARCAGMRELLLAITPPKKIPNWPSGITPDDKT